MLASLEAAHQQQQRFLVDASHELRAPITSISCNLELLATAPHLPDKEVQEALTDARIEAARMGRLVNDLLVLAHTDAVQNNDASAKSSTKHTREVDLDSLMLEVFRQYRSASPEQGQQNPRLLLQHTTPVQVYGDADLLKQALVALVDNALRYTPHEGCITLSLVEENAHAVLKVHDTGLGIAPEDMLHIFERFYRSERTRVYNAGGSGLGLSIVQSIVQAHQGSIEVESVCDTGSTFTLRLPVAKQA
jgi:signal transduction histidine kinase